MHAFMHAYIAQRKVLLRSRGSGHDSLTKYRSTMLNAHNGRGGDTTSNTWGCDALAPPIAQIRPSRICAPTIPPMLLPVEAHRVKTQVENALGHAMPDHVGALVCPRSHPTSNHSVWLDCSLYPLYGLTPPGSNDPAYREGHGKAGAPRHPRVPLMAVACI